MFFFNSWAKYIFVIIINNNITVEPWNSANTDAEQVCLIFFNLHPHRNLSWDMFNISIWTSNGSVEKNLTATQPKTQNNKIKNRPAKTLKNVILRGWNAGRLCEDHHSHAKSLASPLPYGCLSFSQFCLLWGHKLPGREYFTRARFGRL